LPLHVSVYIYDHLQRAHEQCLYSTEHNERTSMEFSLVTAQSTAHEPHEDGRIYGPKHVGASFLKCCKC